MSEPRHRPGEAEIRPKPLQQEQREQRNQTTYEQEQDHDQEHERRTEILLRIRAILTDWTAEDTESLRRSDKEPLVSFGRGEGGVSITQFYSVLVSVPQCRIAELQAQCRQNTNDDHHRAAERIEGRE